MYKSNVVSSLLIVITATAGQSVEYKAKDRQVVWTIKKFTGGTELTLRTKISLSAASTGSVRKELGPIRCVALKACIRDVHALILKCLLAWLQYELRDPDVQRVQFASAIPSHRRSTQVLQAIALGAICHHV